MEEQENVIEGGFEELVVPEEALGSQENTDIQEPESEILSQQLEKGDISSSVFESTTSEEDSKQLSYLADFVAREANLENGDFYVGDQENPIKKNVSDLNERELLSLYKFYSSQNQDSPVDETEREFLEMFRKGEYETLYSQLAEALEKEPSSFNQGMLPERLEEDQLLVWKIKSDFPDLNDDQVIEELEAMKASATYDAKLEQISKQYEQYSSAYNEHVAQQEKLALQRDIEQNRAVIEETAQNVDNLFGFGIDDEIKERAFQNLFSFEEGTTPFIEFIDQPEGMYTAAVALEMLPEIAEYVNGLKDQIDDLNQQINERKTFIEDSVAPEFENSWEDELEDFGTFQ